MVEIERHITYNRIFCYKCIPEMSSINNNDDHINIIVDI